MLHQVVEYAVREELAAEPGFAPKDARWAILCTPSGEYLGIVELGDASLRRNPGRSFAKAPDLSQPEMKAGGVTKSHFLIDTAGVVAGYGKDAPQEKHQYFVGLLEQASKAAPVLGAAARILRSDEQVAKLRADLEEHKAKATDKVTLQIDGEFPVESESWHEWWRAFRRGLQTSKERGRKEATAKMLCFLSGRVGGSRGDSPEDQRADQRRRPGDGRCSDRVQTGVVPFLWPGAIGERRDVGTGGEGVPGAV